MKVTVRLYRVTTIHADDLAQAAGVPAPPDITGSPEGASWEASLLRGLREKFGPPPPRFRIFVTSRAAIAVGMEAMGFDIREPETPHAGLVLADPLHHEDVLRIDGAIESELNRMGLGTDFEGYEWRVAYEIRGTLGN